jgi:hypothetical protein
VYILDVIGHFSLFKKLNADYMQKHQKKTLFYRAVEEGHIQFIDILARKCNAYLLDIADENGYARYHYPLVAAVQHDRPKVLKLVIDIIKGERT